MSENETTKLTDIVQEPALEEVVEDTSPEVLTCDQLVYVIERMFTNIVPGRDFLVIQQFHPDGPAVSSASLYTWRLNIPIPTPEEIQIVWKRVKPDWEAKWAQVTPQGNLEVVRAM